MLKSGPVVRVPTGSEIVIDSNPYVLSQLNRAATGS